MLPLVVPRIPCRGRSVSLSARVVVAKPTRWRCGSAGGSEVIRLAFGSKQILKYVKCKFSDFNLISYFIT